MSTASTHPPLDLDPTPATPIVLGTMAWGSVPPPPPDADPGAGPEGPAGAAQAEAAVERARRALRAGIEAGVDLLDTADIYGPAAPRRPSAGCCTSCPTRSAPP